MRSMTLTYQSSDNLISQRSLDQKDHLGIACWIAFMASRTRPQRIEVCGRVVPYDRRFAALPWMATHSGGNRACGSLPGWTFEICPDPARDIDVCLRTPSPVLIITPAQDDAHQVPFRRELVDFPNPSGRSWTASTRVVKSQVQFRLRWNRRRPLWRRLKYGRRSAFCEGRLYKANSKFTSSMAASSARAFQRFLGYDTTTLVAPTPGSRRQRMHRRAVYC